MVSLVSMLADSIFHYFAQRASLSEGKHRLTESFVMRAISVLGRPILRA
jgi:hypothetical protein